MIVFVFGNPDLAFDSLPLRILPALREKFSDIVFEIKDPNEEWDVPSELVVLDTVEGIADVRVFSDLKSFVPAPRISLHDFDAFANLRLLEKLGKLKKITIIGVPPMMGEEKALEEVSGLLRIHK